MSTHKNIDRVCAGILACAVLLALLFVNGEAIGIRPASAAMGYEERIFDTSRVHTIDIVMDGWEDFIDTCENEAYSACSVVIDGEACRNVGIRAKGNTSLTSVSSMGSDRYSFKIEFDQYDSTKSYYGLDKLSLNNAIQDTTYMKDYLTYRMMAAFGVDAPLCSYVYLTVNGEDWGLYLAVEGVEEAFLQRNYGRDYGELYKPDSMSMGGGRGNGQGFDPADAMDAGDSQPGGAAFDPGDAPGREEPEGVPSAPFDGGEAPEGDFAPSAPPDGGGMGGMGSSDVKLQYIDDDPDSYPNIFDNAKTDASAADRSRLIQSLKALGEQEDIPSVVNVEEVLRYFVVHNFVCNGDSYTGAMVHNYYLYEEDGRLSMIPWDYNLAFGTFQSSDATASVNSPIDTPVSGGSTEDRPMVDWIFSSEAYMRMYHQYFAEFLETVDFSALIGEAAALIAPYVEKDPTKFYTYEEFETGVETLRTFCLLRAESVAGQLGGTIPSTTAGQSADRSALVDASQIELSDMGSMNNGAPGGNGDRPDGTAPAAQEAGDGGSMPEMPDGAQPPDRPDGAGDAQPGGRDRAFDGPGGAAPAQDGGSGWIWLAASLAVLLAGLAAAFRFRR